MDARWAGSSLSQDGRLGWSRSSFDSNRSELERTVMTMIDETHKRIEDVATDTEAWLNKVKQIVKFIFPTGNSRLLPNHDGRLIRG
jgi:predicted site-specific integrase-resolvase